MVVNRRGLLVVARRGKEVVTRNVSLFKKFNGPERSSVDAEVHASDDDLTSVQNSGGCDEDNTESQVDVPPAFSSGEASSPASLPLASSGWADNTRYHLRQNPAPSMRLCDNFVDV
ncbi:hypothetical protein NDU88_003672 [Pleurodeles waltl]|uniref:Uncharacterized protein n=1 Tax=Pleurodeles waltl TaxID=8319 RepID=A0AAV7W6A1_PLEWA|nr:hypothetical protein NDU88_003672 [Pleurodeles waltl]